MSQKVVKNLTERSNLTTSLRVDREKCTINDARLLGWDSGNRRNYLKEGCSKNTDKYVGARVNIDHGQKNVSSRFARVTDATPRDDGIYGTLHYNPKHPLAEMILWFAENDPNAIGLSHDADGRVSTNADGSQTVHEIVKVNFVDIVSDPATTKGLFESMDPMNPTPDDGAADFKNQLGELAKSLFTSEDFDHKAVKEKLKHLLNLLKTEDKDTDETPDPKVDKTEESLKVENAKLKGELDTYRVKEALENKRVLARKLCDTLQVPKVAITEYFISDLAGKADEASMREAIEDRRKVLNLSKTGKPTSAGQADSPNLSVDDFCNQLLKG